MWNRFLSQIRRSPELDGGFKEALEGCSVSRGLSPSQLETLSSYLRVKEFQNQEIVCHCPTAFHDAFILLGGAVSVTKRLGSDLHVLQLETTEAVFNISPLVGRAQDVAGVRALGKVYILAMDTARPQQLLSQDPDLGYVFIRNLTRSALSQCDRQLVPCLQRVA